MSNKVLDKIKELAESVLSGTDFFLVDVEVKGSRNPVVWIYVDGEERGVSMDECAGISDELGFLMDAHELFDGRYRLNVSSPGLSRPLSDKRQYPKNRGRKAKVKYETSNGEYRKVEGTLQDVKEQEIILKKEDGTAESIRFEKLVETKIVPTF